MKSLDFVAIDVETADSAYPESICQIGLAIVRGGEIAEQATYFVSTTRQFGWWQRQNLAFDEDVIAGAPTFAEVSREISAFMTGAVFSHTSYDKFSVTRACRAHNCDFPNAIWLDSAQLVRRAWPEKYARSGYGLQNVAKDMGIEFKHHDAGEDARAVAEIVIRASLEHGLDVDGWAQRVRSPIFPGADRLKEIRRDGNIDGPLYGEVVVLTGGFDLPQSEQSSLAAFAGCQVDTGVTKKTTLVVVGDDRFRRGERSGKWERAEELITAGVPIRIISESDFREMISD